MEAYEEELIHSLAPDHSELRAAYEEHSRLNMLVDELGAKNFLSADEEMQKKDLQKRKLVEKDKIMRILAEYRRVQSAGSAP